MFESEQIVKARILGPLLQKKALLIAANLNIQGFVASNGWLDKFRTRHNIHFKALSGLTPDPLLIDDGYLGGTIEQITDSVLNNFIEVDVKVAGKQEPIFEEEEEEPAFEEDHPIISYTEALNCIDKLEKYVAEKDPDSLILTQTLKSNIVKQKEMKKQTSLLNYFSVYSKFVNK